MVGTGVTETTTLYVEALLQPLAETVYAYVTFTGDEEVLTSVSFTFPVPVAAALVIFATTALDQENVAPVVELVGVYVNAVPLQTAAGVKELPNVGTGVIVTTTL